MFCLSEFALFALFARASAAENRSVRQLYRANTQIPEAVNIGINSTTSPFYQLLQKGVFVPLIDNLVIILCKILEMTVIIVVFYKDGEYFFSLMNGRQQLEV